METIYLLTAFIGKNDAAVGLNEGDIAPDFEIATPTGYQSSFNLAETKGKFVLLIFWASYDAESRIRNVIFCNALADVQELQVVSISFDRYESIFHETTHKDGISPAVCLVETSAESSPVYKAYQLQNGFSSYLLDEKGIIVAKNIAADDIPKEIEKLRKEKSLNVQ